MVYNFLELQFHSLMTVKIDLNHLKTSKITIFEARK